MRRVGVLVGVVLLLLGTGRLGVRGEEAGEGLVVFCFDDGRMSTVERGWPAMEARGWAAAAFVNPGHVGNQTFLMDVAELEVLDGSGWDVASHGWTHRNPMEMDEEELEEHLVGARDWLLKYGFWRGARIYSPPKGDCDEGILARATELYRVIRAWDLDAGELGVCAKFPPGYEYVIVRADDAVAWEEVQAAIDGMEAGDVVLLVFHDIVEEIEKPYDASVGRFEQVVGYVEERGVEVVTLSDVLDEWQGERYWFPVWWAEGLDIGY